MNLVSIITPIYNAEKYLEETITSVLAQTYENWEMILVDDKSVDNSWNIIQKFQQQDERIKGFQLQTNSGAGIARNKAIEKAKGRYIAFLDSDDLWHSEKLKLQLQFMEQNAYAFTFTSYQQMTEEGEKTKVVSAKKKVTYKKALFENPIGCLTAMYDVNLLGKKYMPTIRKRQDYALWLKILKETDGYGLDKTLAFYRLRKDSISSNKFNLIKYQWRLYRKIEGFSIIKSLFYLIGIILNKVVR